MEFDITRNTRNELLQRKEIEFTLRFDGATPRRSLITGKLAALLNVNEKQLVLDSLKTIFGTTEIRGSARIYDTEEQRARTERPYLMTRGIQKPKEEGA